MLIPPAVVEELERPKSSMPVIPIAGFEFLRVEVPSDRHLVQTLTHELHQGEAEAIALALEISADRIMIDELAGRLVAARLGLVPVGVLGILSQAKERGLVSAIRPLIDRLQNEINFYVSAKLRAQLLERAGEI